MDLHNLLYETRDGVAFVTVNRPDKLNALNAETISELARAFCAVRDDAKVGAVILTGSGEKAFIAGADIGDLSKLDARGAKQAALLGQEVMGLIEHLGKPVIAAVNGFALGGGCEIALACTFRVASENARFGQPEVNLGLIPGYGGTQRLTRLVGRGRGLELVLTGDQVDAQEALRIGLVNHVYPREKLLAEAEGIARKILSKAPLAVRAALEAVNRGLETTLEEGLLLEADLFGLCAASEDWKEGTKAFLEKRKPAFQGR